MTSASCSAYDRPVTCEAGAAAQLGDRLGGEHGGLLVAHVVDREAGLVRGVVEREHVAAGEREHLLDAGRAQCREGELSAVTLDPLAHRHSRRSVRCEHTLLVSRW